MCAVVVAHFLFRSFPLLFYRHSPILFRPLDVIARRSLCVPLTAGALFLSLSTNFLFYFFLLSSSSSSKRIRFCDYSFLCSDFSISNNKGGRQKKRSLRECAAHLLALRRPIGNGAATRRLNCAPGFERRSRGGEIRCRPTRSRSDDGGFHRLEKEAKKDEDQFSMSAVS